MTILEKIRDYKLNEVIQAKKQMPVSRLESSELFLQKPRGFLSALQKYIANDQIGLIAEIKKASPSKGLIRADFDVQQLAKSYTSGGAACLSVLTDKPSFQGDSTYLALVKSVTNIPVLRKDFMFDPYQIIESRSLGADCILLIMACLEDSQAQELESIAFDLGMDVLIETHNQQEIERSLTYLKSDLIGINNRNLHNFVTNLEISCQLASLIPQDKLLVSESGIYTHDDIIMLQQSNIMSYLVGESLMRQDNVEMATRELLGS